MIIALYRTIHHRNGACLKLSALSSPCPFQDTVKYHLGIVNVWILPIFKHLFSSKHLFGNVVPRIYKGGVLYHLYWSLLSTDHSNSSNRSVPTVRFKHHFRENGPGSMHFQHLANFRARNCYNKIESWMILVEARHTQSIRPTHQPTFQ